MMKSGKRKWLRIAIGSLLVVALTVVTIWQYLTAGTTLPKDSRMDGYLVRFVSSQTQVLSEEKLGKIVAWYNAAEKVRAEGAPADAPFQITLTRGSKIIATFFYTPEEKQIYVIYHRAFMGKSRIYSVNSPALVDYFDLLSLEFQPDQL